MAKKLPFSLPPAQAVRATSYEERHGTAQVVRLLRKDSEVRIAEMRKDYHLYYASNGGTGFGDYLRREQMLLLARKQQATREEALTKARQKAAQVQTAINRRLAAIFANDRFDKKVQDSLTLGQSIADSLGTLTNALGPEAAVATCVVGYVVGAVVGFWPHEKQKLLDDCRAMFSALNPYERWLVMPGFRGMIDGARQRMRLPITQPWRIGNDGGTFGHNLGEGIDVTVLFILEVMNEYDWVPADSDPRVSAYTLATLSSYHENDKKLKEFRDVWDKAKRGLPNAWVANLILSNGEKTAGKVRTEAMAYDMPDIGFQLMTQNFVDRIVAIYGDAP